MSFGITVNDPDDGQGGAVDDQDYGHGDVEDDDYNGPPPSSPFSTSSFQVLIHRRQMTKPNLLGRFDVADQMCMVSYRAYWCPAFCQCVEPLKLGSVARIFCPLRRFCILFAWCMPKI